MLAQRHAWQLEKRTEKTHPIQYMKIDIIHKRVGVSLLGVYARSLRVLAVFARRVGKIFGFLKIYHFFLCSFSQRK